MGAAKHLGFLGLDSFGPGRRVYRRVYRVSVSQVSALHITSSFGFIRLIPLRPNRSKAAQRDFQFRVLFFPLFFLDKSSTAERGAACLAARVRGVYNN